MCETVAKCEPRFWKWFYRDIEAMMMFEESMNMTVLANWEWRHVCFHYWASVLVNHKEGTGLYYLYLPSTRTLIVLYACAAKRSGLFVAISLTIHVLVICMRASLGYTLSPFIGQIAYRTINHDHQWWREPQVLRLGWTLAKTKMEAGILEDLDLVTLLTSLTRSVPQ